MATFWPGSGGGGGGPAVVVSATEPASPAEGDLWYNTSTGDTKVYVGSAYSAMLTAHDTWDLTH